MHTSKAVTRKATFAPPCGLLRGGYSTSRICRETKLYNPRHPERTLLYQIIADYFETWDELASAGQFYGQGGHHTPSPARARRSANIWSAASSPTALLVPVTMIAATTTVSPSPARVVVSAPRVIHGAW
jgi:hypothetical protein